MEENIFNKKSKSPGKKRSKNFSLLDFDFRMSMRTKKLRQEQMKYDKIIDDLSNEISKKLSYGIDESNMKLSLDINLQDVVKYILKKESKNKYHVIIIRYYLFQFPTLLETMNLSLKYYETKEILNKIAIHLKKEEVEKNNVVFYNGQIGKSFYIILEGEVSVLIPSEYSVDITMDKYLQYLKFIYELNDYELLRLSYESNKNLLDKYDYEVENELKYFDYGFDKVLPNNIKKEEIDVQTYIDRFLFMEKEEYKSESLNEININFENINNNPEVENSKNITDSLETNNENDIFSNKEENLNDLNNSNTSNYSIVQNNIHNNEEIEKKYTKKKAKHNFSLWKYVEIIKLGKGKSFGEIALQSNKNKRTATIIALTDCFFGILEKDEYLLFVKETIEKMRRNNIERLLNTKLFEGITFINFETRYFNCFTFSKEKKGTYLFKRGNTRSNIIYIKIGEVQLEIIASCKQLDNIILSIGGNPYDPFLNNLIKKNKKISDFINNPKKFNISIFSKGDIIGTDELVYISSNEFNIEKIPDIEYISNNINNKKLEENCFLFNGIYLTGSEVFKLDLHFLTSMLKDKTIKANYEKLKKEKKERLIERLLNIKYNTIMNFYNLINDSKNNENIINTNLNERKNNSFSLNKKTIVNRKLFFSMKNFGVRNSKINNINNINKINTNNNKINTTINTRNNSFLDDISKNKGKTKDFFYPEPNIQKRNEKKEIQKRSLLASFMNNNNYKGKITKKIFLSGNNTLHKFKSEKIIPINKNKTYYNSNTYSDLKKISISNNTNNWRNIISNLSNNNTIYNNEDNISKNNSSDKMSTYKSFYKLKNPKKLKLSDALINSFKDPKIKMLKNQKIPKFLMRNALIYNIVIDKILLKQNKTIFNNPILSNNKDNKDNSDNNPINSIDKYNEDDNKIFNTLDVLAFDDILNNIKKNKNINKKKFLPFLENSKKQKRFNYNSFPRTAYNVFMKKGK